MKNEIFQEEVYHWTDIKFSPIKLDPRMLLRDGFVVRRRCFLRDENFKQAPSQYRFVCYDRSFVVFHLTSQLTALKDIRSENFNSIMEEVFTNLSQLE